MKRLLKLVVVAILGLSPLLVGEPALAQQFSCETGFSGPDSQNMCISVATYSCSVENTNTVTIVNENKQQVFSGDVELVGNTNGGSATSGTATNTSGTTFVISIDNSVPSEPGVCTAAVIVPATETPEPVTPVENGGGAVEALPVTSGDETLQTGIIIASVLVGLAAASAGGVAWIRSRKSL